MKKSFALVAVAMSLSLTACSQASQQVTVNNVSDQTSSPVCKKVKETVKSIAKGTAAGTSDIGIWYLGVGSGVWVDVADEFKGKKTSEAMYFWLDKYGSCLTPDETQAFTDYADSLASENK